MSLVFVIVVLLRRVVVFIFFFNDTATTEIYTLSLHDALPIFPPRGVRHLRRAALVQPDPVAAEEEAVAREVPAGEPRTARGTAEPAAEPHRLAVAQHPPGAERRVADAETSPAAALAEPERIAPIELARIGLGRRLHRRPSDVAADERRLAEAGDVARGRAEVEVDGLRSRRQRKRDESSDQERPHDASRSGGSSRSSLDFCTCEIRSWSGFVPEPTARPLMMMSTSSGVPSKPIIRRKRTPSRPQSTIPINDASAQVITVVLRRMRSTMRCQVAARSTFPAIRAS